MTLASSRCSDPLKAFRAIAFSSGDHFNSRICIRSGPPRTAFYRVLATANRLTWALRVIPHKGAKFSIGPQRLLQDLQENSLVGRTCAGYSSCAEILQSEP